MPFVITSPCVDVKDRSCASECPVDCIYEADQQLLIHPDECIDCYACVPACPVDAIVQDDRLEEHEKVFLDLAIEWFAQHPDASGGAFGSPFEPMLAPAASSSGDE